MIVAAPVAREAALAAAVMRAVREGAAQLVDLAARMAEVGKVA